MSILAPYRIDANNRDCFERFAIYAGKGDGIAGFQIHMEWATCGQQLANDDIAGTRIAGIQVPTLHHLQDWRRL